MMYPSTGSTAEKVNFWSTEDMSEEEKARLDEPPEWRKDMEDHAKKRRAEWDKPDKIYEGIRNELACLQPFSPKGEEKLHSLQKKWRVAYEMIKRTDLLRLRGHALLREAREVIGRDRERHYME